MERRDFFKKAAVTAGAAALGTSTLEAGLTHQPIDNREISKFAFPEKRPLITFSDRPPLLETPRDVFTSALTPNDQFFVRWHMPDIPTHIDPEKFTVNVNGLVEHELKISLNELKTQYEQVEVTAVLQCGGNSRSAFTPTAGGIQWGNGAMGCATWKGVRLSDILDKAGLKKGAEWIGFNGSEKAAYYETPEFIRELRLDELDDHVILAYEMNGEDLPYLNGYPLRLVIPGSYSDSWVKMLSNITVTDKYKKLFFMDVAYRVPDNECECETPQKRFPKTKPINKMNVKSVIGYPTPDSIINHKSHVVVRGVAWDDGHGIQDVFISIDGGKTWDKAILDSGKLGRYAYRAFRYPFKPMGYGKLTIMAKAVNKIGQEQPFAEDVKWNHGGYKFNGIDKVTVEVI
ncbi:molybdopterin-dependent oxidoreductase [Sulfurovum sp. ST-21]|uniref:Molybdopterin-dependent oxidoreductase n=1 Tax=Sulfurovum indicum TaxID=2779528 RepID=A0A7M1S0K8_9BACT|nr:molybdopterin-dependent oxidoreductase [Sulfurovum indicum]QOR61043.1 molybdopterin-dependent oxidoreductase [Sulfurovum indicum]HIP19113.1 twin-arginine translocation signal domain-containing protein [Sulfurovum sp.]